MKTFRLLAASLVAALCVGFSSCGEENEVPIEPQTPKEYMVSIGYTGEIYITESPLSKSETQDLYGIQIYSCPISSQEYKYDQSGLFDDINKMTVKLSEGYKYKFVATMVVNGKDLIYWKDPGYSYPFTTFLDLTGERTRVTELDNQFWTSSSIYLGGLSNGYTSFKGKFPTSYKIPNTDRYYGEMIDYIPKENDKINIYMKRAVFGVKIMAENFTEGTIHTYIEDGPEIKFSYPQTEQEEILTFKELSQIAQETSEADLYKENINLSFTWEKPDGRIVNLGSKAIEFKRNKRTTILIKVTDPNSPINSNIAFDFETKPMEEDKTITI